ncbi:MAG: aminotransferase class V-fold PLP-dependent enzyme [Chloroflexi bacterium]|nr:aminotransferase class V-fold PLP-dependent enzyme [Chloroflexota bacterium]
MSEQANIYEELGIKRAINAMGNVTLLGGSILSPKVQAAMDAANQYFVPMAEVMEKTGQAIANMLNTESGYVTSGCFAALVLGMAGIMTGNDPAKIAQLPDTTGMKNEFLLQKKSRYHYDRCISVPGGKLVEVGDEQGTTAEQLSAAIGPNTAGIFFYARGETAFPGTLSLQEVVRIAHAHGVPVIVDAAAEIYPVERMTTLSNSGADLICFGSKYLGAFNSAGILAGRRDLVDAASHNSFVGYETYINRSIGRGYKLDRQEVIGVVVALREWLQMDHEERLQQQADRIETITAALADLPHVKAETIWDSERDAWMRLHVTLDPAALGKSPKTIASELKEGDPSVWVRVDQNELYVMVNTLQDGEDQLVARRLREVLQSA